MRVYQFRHIRAGGHSSRPSRASTVPSHRAGILPARDRGSEDVLDAVARPGSGSLPGRRRTRARLRAAHGPDAGRRHARGTSARAGRRGSHAGVDAHRRRAEAVPRRAARAGTRGHGPLALPAGAERRRRRAADAGDRRAEAAPRRTRRPLLRDVRRRQHAGQRRAVASRRAGALGRRPRECRAGGEDRDHRHRDRPDAPVLLTRRLLDATGLPEGQTGGTRRRR